MSEFKVSDLEDLAIFLCAIRCFDVNIAIECLDAALPVIELGLAGSPLKSWQSIREIRENILGDHWMAGLMKEKASRVQNKKLKQITEFLRADRVINELSSCRLGEWQDYGELLCCVRRVNRRKHREIVELIDWTRLDTRTVGIWRNPPYELRRLVHSLAINKGSNPVCQWVLSHAAEIEEMDPVIAGISPDAGVVVLRRGGRLNLAGNKESDWHLMAWALTRIAAIDNSLTSTIIISNEQLVLRRLEKLEAIDCRELPVFLKKIEDLDPSLFARLFRNVDWNVAALTWPARLKEGDRKIRAGARKVMAFVVKHGKGDLCKFAAQILGKPRLAQE